MTSIVPITPTKFYHYSQNNTGGSFTLNEAAGITHHVIIEAIRAKHANELAEQIGLYFDGSGDCGCCGNRWSSLWGDDNGDDEPMIYGKPVHKYDSMAWMQPGKEIVVHYLDGRKEWFGVCDKTELLK